MTSKNLSGMARFSLKAYWREGTQSMYKPSHTHYLKTVKVPVNASLGKNVFGKPLKGLSVGIPAEMDKYDNSASFSPALVESLVKMGLKVNVESGAGNTSMFSDKFFSLYGAHICGRKEALGSNIVFKSFSPVGKDIDMIKDGSVVFCEYRTRNDDSILKLEKKHVAVHDTSFIANGILRDFEESNIQVMNLGGFTWRIISDMMVQLKRPLRACTIDGVSKPRIKIISVGRPSSFLKLLQRMLEQLGAEFTSMDAKFTYRMDKIGKVNSEVLQKFADYDVVLSRLKFSPHDLSFPTPIFDKMKKGAVLFDFHYKHTPQFVKTFPDHTIEVDGKTVVGITAMKHHHPLENMAKFRAANVYANVLAPMAKNGKFEFFEDIVKNSRAIYDEKDEYDKILRYLHHPENRHIVVGGQVIFSAIAFTMIGASIYAML